MKHIIHNTDDVHIQSYAHLVLLNKVYSVMESKRWNRAKNAFLKEQSKKGPLTCFYCDKSDLKIKVSKRGEQVTVDHYIPKSGGGDPFSASNFVVCCHSCNQKKASMSPEEFLSSDYIKKKKS